MITMAEYELTPDWAAILGTRAQLLNATDTLWFNSLSCHIHNYDNGEWCAIIGPTEYDTPLPGGTIVSFGNAETVANEIAAICRAFSELEKWTD